MTDEQHKEMMAMLARIEENTKASKDGGYNNEDNSSNLETIIELLQKILKDES